VTNKLVTYIEKAPLKPQVPRVTMTLPLLNNSARIIFLVAGAEKIALLKEIEKNPLQAGQKYPVTQITAREEVIWFISEE
jgi:6-phosphogluconolactonase